MKIFAAITKVDENSDGTITVEGIASTEAVDSDGEVVKAAAIEAAIPDFMRYGTGNLREMHQPLAAGTVDKAEVVDGVTHISGTVVDPVAVKKVQTGVYKGFSIGGKVTSRDDLNKKHVTGVKLVEISLVDRPANPEAVLSMWKAEGVAGDVAIVEAGAEPSEAERAALVEKFQGGADARPNKGEDFTQVWRSERDGSIHLKKADLLAHHKALDDAAALDAVAGVAIEKLNEIEAALATQTTEEGAKEASESAEDLDKRKFTAEERRDAASSGAAMKDGSYPIENESDLENAIRAFGRAKNKPATKRHIIRRAKALGATDKLPADWRGSTKKAEDGADLQKGISLYGVANLLQLLACLDDAEESFELDTFWSGGTNVPDDLKTRFGSLLIEFGDIVADALEVILGSMSKEERDEAIARAEQPTDVAKTEESGDLEKIAGERDIFKAAFEKVSSKLDEIAPQVADMAKRIKDLEAQPMPAKTAGPMAITKEQDTIGTTAEPVITKVEAERMLAELSPEDRALALIKFSRENPRFVQFR